MWNKIMIDSNKLINIFLYAPEQYKIETIKKLYNDDDSTAKSYMKKSDKERSTYYEVISNPRWGNKNNYDICINTTDLVIKEIVPVLAKIFWNTF